MKRKPFVFVEKSDKEVAALARKAATGDQKAAKAILDYMTAIRIDLRQFERPKRRKSRG